MFEQPSPFRFSRMTVLLLLFILFCGAALRLASLRHEALEGDEIFSRNVVLLSPANEISVIRNDLVHPPLYYFILQATVRVWGAGPIGIRIFSLLCGITSIGLIAFLGCTLPDSRFAGILAAALLAFNQIHIFYSQEARSYAWYALLVLIFFFWVWKITRLNGKLPNVLDWVLGAILMSAIVYTHYVGAIYVGCATLAILLSRIPLTRRLAALACTAIAALCFLPWIIAIATVYKQKQGIGGNLDWEGHPSVYALKQLFASALGVLDIRGGTTLVLLVILFLTVPVLLLHRQKGMRRSPIVLTLLFLSFLPPFVVFLLSRPPFNLPIFGIRHLLPSLALIILLCCYGMDLLAQQVRSRYTLVFSAGSIVLIAITVIPTLHAIVFKPSRIPYDLISQAVKKGAAGVPAYTTWPYGIGAPVNLYCATTCVTELPLDHQRLPTEIILLFRPSSSRESQQYQQLQREGFSIVEKHFYTNGENSIYGVNLVVLKRQMPHT